MTRSPGNNPLRGLKIISGGQTGVDRAALDFAIQRQLPHGGWCPLGRVAEDGCIPDCYQLQETPTRSYAQRTEWNVRDSDATLIISLQRAVSGGTSLTMALARRRGRPLLHLTQKEDVAASASALRGFLRVYDVQRLNVAGPRASQAPGIEGFVHQVLHSALADRLAALGCDS